MKPIVRSLWVAFVGLTLLPALSLQGCTAVTAQGTDPIRLPVTIIRSNPVTTITVGGRTVQAIVDTGGGALALSKEILESVGAVSLEDSGVSTDILGHETQLRRFRVPVVTIGGQTFHDMVAIEASDRGVPQTPNGIGRQFLSQYFVVVDYAAAAITLWPLNTKNLTQTKCGRRRIPMEHTEEDNQLVVSAFDTQSGRIRLLFDTGATYSMLPEVIAEKLQLATVLHGPNSPKFYQSRILSAAGQDFGPMEFVILPLKLPGDFEGMLGRNFFEHHVVCLDYKRREIRVR